VIFLGAATWARAQQPGIQRKSLLQQDGPPGYQTIINFLEFAPGAPSSSTAPDKAHREKRSRRPKLIHDNKLDKGGHFAAWEQPKLLVAEVRAGLRSLRNAV